MHLSVKTIETHRERIKHKLGIEHSPELTRRATEWLLEQTRKRIGLTVRHKPKGR